LEAFIPFLPLSCPDLTVPDRGFLILSSSLLCALRTLKAIAHM
jgi:hypothetical protein